MNPTLNPPRYFIKTYGCQMNYSDTERLTTILEHLGYTPGESEEEAEILFFNTCSIRQKAEDKLYGCLSQLSKARLKNPDLIVGVTGCMVRKSSTPHSKKRDPLVHHDTVDIALRIEDIAKLGALIKEARPKHPRAKFMPETLNEGTLENYFKIAPKRESKAQVWIPIQSGCDKFCTFCIVPFSRGREKSRPMDEILKECEQAVENGALEITLIGQTVDSYGLSVGDKLSGQFEVTEEIPNVVFNTKIFENVEDQAQRFNMMASAPQAKSREAAERPFVTLLRRIDALKSKGLKRLRYTSPHPQDFSEDLILLHKNLETLQPYIHLPVQAGNNEVLKAMRRPYTREHYLHLIELIKKHLPDCAISTDIIVGFPGETENQFEDTYRLMEEVGFDMAFLAQFSPRKGTYAEKHMHDNVPRKEKSKRFDKLNALLRKNSALRHRPFIGKTVEVLVEKQEGTQCSGRTPHYKQVFFESGRNTVGKLVEVKVIDAEDWCLQGTLL